MIGPTVIQAIISESGSNWKGLFGLCLTASLIIWCCIDVKKGRRDAVAWADKANRHEKSVEGASDPVAVDSEVL